MLSNLNGQSNKIADNINNKVKNKNNGKINNNSTKSIKLSNNNINKFNVLMFKHKAV